jgi:hypothetical protein
MNRFWLFIDAPNPSCPVGGNRKYPNTRFESDTHEFPAVVVGRTGEEQFEKIPIPRILMFKTVVLTVYIKWVAQ